MTATHRRQQCVRRAIEVKLSESNCYTRACNGQHHSDAGVAVVELMQPRPLCVHACAVRGCTNKHDRKIIVNSYSLFYIVIVRNSCMAVHQGSLGKKYTFPYIYCYWKCVSKGHISIHCQERLRKDMEKWPFQYIS